METKHWYLSKGVVGGLVAAILIVYKLLGYMLPEGVTEDTVTDNIVNVTTSIAALAATAIAIYGRVAAKSKISK